MAKNKFTVTLKSTGQSKSTSVNIEDPLQFIATLERDNSSYNGEFGFDWMRVNYENICKDYEKLKKEYTPIKIYEEEYFVPWLSMFPKQDNVKLILKIKKLKGTIKDSDIIKLPPKNGINFKPAQLKISEANDVEIKINCTTPLTENTAISLLDKNDKEIGKINIFKNDKTYKLKARFVEVKFKGVLTYSDIDLGTENTINFSNKTSIASMPSMDISNTTSLNMSDTIDKWKAYIEDNQNIFINRFNQALIKYESFKKDNGKIDYNKIIIDFDNFTIGTDIRVDSAVNRLKKSISSIDIDAIACDMEEFIKGLHETHVEKNGDEVGITVFLLPLIIRYSNPPESVNTNYLDAFSDDIFRDGRYIMLTKYSSLFKKDTLVHEAAHTLGLFHSFQTKTEDHGRDVIPNHTFDYQTTENIMDYSNTTLTFWKWQWEKMLQDTIDLKLIQ